MGTAATAAIAFTVGIEVVETALMWISAYQEPSPFAYWLTVVSQTTAAVLFVMWMHKARQNADQITSKHQARWTGMWVFVGWIIPVANLFIPYAVMQDIWRGSDHARPMVGLQRRPQSGLVKAWWFVYIGSNVLFAVIGYSAAQDVPFLATVAVLGWVAAAVLAARMIRTVNEMQVSEPTASPAPAA